MSMVASHWELTTTNWEQLSKLILLQIHKKLPKILTLTILWSFSVCSKLDSWKSSVSGCLMNWLLIKKKLSFWSIIFFYSIQQQQTIYQLDCEMTQKMDFIQELLMTSGWTEKRLQSTSQSQTCRRKMSWSLCDRLLLVWSTIAFWIQVKPFNLRNICTADWWDMQNHNAWNWHWSAEWF